MFTNHTFLTTSWASENHNHYFSTQTTDGPKTQKYMHQAAGQPTPTPASCAEVALYLESWHRVCLHIEARVAALIQGPVVGLLETGYIGT